MKCSRFCSTALVYIPKKTCILADIMQLAVSHIQRLKFDAKVQRSLITHNSKYQNLQQLQ